MAEAIGPDATETLALRGEKEWLIAKVCGGCAKMLRALGWK